MYECVNHAVAKLSSTCRRSSDHYPTLFSFSFRSFVLAGTKLAVVLCSLPCRCLWRKVLAPSL